MYAHFKDNTGVFVDHRDYYMVIIILHFAERDTTKCKTDINLTLVRYGFRIQ